MAALIAMLLLSKSTARSPWPVLAGIMQRNRASWSQLSKKVTEVVEKV